MKFLSLKSTENKTYRIRSFDKGCCPGSFSEECPGGLSFAGNVMFYDNLLKTRKGLCSDTNKVIHYENNNLYSDVKYSVSDNTVNIGEKRFKAVLSEITDLETYYNCFVDFLCADGTLINGGYLNFNRISSEYFYVPSNILFYDGKPVNGGGIFALVSKYNMHDSEDKTYQIYEISSDFESWEPAVDFYTPTVLINGRGTEFEKSKSNDMAFTDKPFSPEAQNLLDGSFKAYFSSDGYSSCFQMPFGNLSDGRISCRVYFDLNYYAQWNIPAGSNSDTQTFFSASVTLNVDRQSGTIYFSSGGEDYPIPVSKKYFGNNIHITAVKDVPGGFQNAVSVDCVTKRGSKLLFSGGEEKSTVYCIDRNNPLYFSADSVCNVGDRQKVSGLLSCKKGVYAFKDNDIFLLSVKEGKKTKLNNKIFENGLDIYSADLIESSFISEKHGCKSRKEMDVYKGIPVWLGKDGKINTFNSKGEVMSLSDNLQNVLSEFFRKNSGEPFVFAGENYFMLICGDKAVIMEDNANAQKNSLLSFKCFNFDFNGISVVGGIGSGAETRFICEGSDGKIIYHAVLLGEKDCDIKIGSNGITVAEKDLSSSLSTLKFDFGNPFKNKFIENIYISAAGRGFLSIFINGKFVQKIKLNSHEFIGDENQLKNVRIVPHLPGVKTLYVTLESDKPLQIGEMIFYYKEEK